MASKPAQAVPSAARWAPLSGIVFVILFVIPWFIASTPDYDESDAKWLDYFDKGSNQAALLASGFLFVLSALALLIFLTVLWNRIALARQPAQLSPLGLVAATAAGTAIAVGGVLNATIAGGMVFGDLEPPADILRAFDELAYPMITVAGFSALALAMAVLSVQARRAGVFGQGLMVFSLISAALTLVALFFFPMLVTLLWVLVVSFMLFRRGTPMAQP